MAYIKKGAVSTYSAALVGVEAQLVEVEADQRQSAQIITRIVGLADKACAEAKDRVKSAVRNSGEGLPRGLFVINLAPADLPKSGTGFDLAMAVAMMIRLGVLRQDSVKGILLLGELAFNGNLRPINGVLSAAQMAFEQGFERIIVPYENAAEAALVHDIIVHPAKSLNEVKEYLQEETILPVMPPSSLASRAGDFDINFKHVRGHAFAKRAIEIAAAGGHNLLMNGPPGSGKTMLARAMLSVMPPMSLPEVIEVTKIHSAAGQLSADKPYIAQRPWRSPHHSASAVSLVGGGTNPKPGEISLAHRGVLFLDELPEFPRQVLENLRQPLEGGMITVSRAKQTIDFPARFLLVAAMNPCPCGFATDSEHKCRCTPSAVLRYQQRLSGPLLDRFDLFLDVPRLVWQELIEGEDCEDSKTIRNRIIKARERQASRQKETGALINQELSSNAVTEHVKLDDDSMKLLETASSQMQLSNRAYYRILRVARTIADLAGAETVTKEHIAESLQYRRIDPS